MKHDIESYKQTLVEIFDKRQTILRDKLIDEIAKARQIDHLEAEKLLCYCRTKDLVKSQHYYSTYFKYSLNIK